ncbi:hypothetical protein SAMN05444359_13129 [Neolewinella agarilytica]|uniref:Uncharacterized protein n=1 Tax=Neolewinella agarilytica TaxID=478744 RepID=A0A1H9MT32_9BACT|nr:hypothetical protein SAMN05444359_13129 [Neolewinella agarilytica]
MLRTYFTDSVFPLPATPRYTSSMLTTRTAMPMGNGGSIQGNCKLSAKTLKVP